MNQAANKIPYGLLTEEEQEQFCEDAKTRGMYEYFNYEGNWITLTGGLFSLDYAYRLKMVEGEIYYYEITNALENYRHGLAIWKNGLWKTPSEMHTLRPATAEEIKHFNQAFEPEAKEPDSAHKPGPVEADLQQKGDRFIIDDRVGIIAIIV